MPDVGWLPVLVGAALGGAGAGVLAHVRRGSVLAYAGIGAAGGAALAIGVQRFGAPEPPPPARTLNLVAAVKAMARENEQPLPRVVQNAYGYWIPVGADDRWTNVHGFVKPFTPEAKARRALLPADAQPAMDRYSKERNKYTYVSADFGTTITDWADEYGRGPQGVGVNALATFAGVAQLALPYVPGIGTGAAFALNAAIALGQGKGLKDAFVSAARATVPAHLQLAFDIGVGVAAGQPIDELALDALEQQYPGSKATYAKGKDIAIKAGL